ncbi:Glucose-1-phosphate adenylyltransferase [compost metagenome]
MYEDERNPDSSFDFGKDIIPLMLSNQKVLYAYPFEGYWRDVGTVQSLWQSNMDLLSDNPPLDLNDPSWRIYTRSPNQPAQYIAPDATVTNSVINEGCIVHGNIDHSVLFYGIEVGEGSVITDSVIMPKVKIGKNVRIHKAIVSENLVIEDNTVLGVNRADEDEILLITDEELSSLKEQGVSVSTNN